jgi:hypothetical protein
MRFAYANRMSAPGQRRLPSLYGIKLREVQKTVGRKGLKGREAAAPAAEPPKSPVFCEAKKAHGKN